GRHSHDPERGIVTQQAGKGVAYDRVIVDDQEACHVDLTSDEVIRAYRSRRTQSHSSSAKVKTVPYEIRRSFRGAGALGIASTKSGARASHSTQTPNENFEHVKQK